MKRADAFLLGATSFVFANCVSYFVRSWAPYIAVFGMRPGGRTWHEAIGFPFVAYEWCFGGPGVPYICASLVNWIGNLAVAMTVSYLLAKHAAHRLSPLWSWQPRVFQCSLRGLFGVVTVAGAVFGLGMTSRSWGLVVRNIVCFAGPVSIYAYFLYRQRLSWISLTVTAVGLTVLTVAVDLRYQEPPVNRHTIWKAMTCVREPEWRSNSRQRKDYRVGCETRMFTGLTVIRATVPIFGLLSLLVLASAAYSTLRQYYPVWASRNVGSSDETVLCDPFANTFPISVFDRAAEGISSLLEAGGETNSLTDNFGNVVELTEVACQEIKRRHSNGEFDPTVVVRIELDSKDPSHVNVTFDFLLADGRDWIGESRGIPIVMDRRVPPELQGCTVDFRGGEFVRT